MFLQSYLSKNKTFWKVSRYIYFQRSLSNVSTTDKMVLYGDKASPPVRFVLMTASHLQIDVNFQQIDLFQGEQKGGLFTKINPLQKVPALAVGNDVIRDSHAISLYLCNMSENRELYPDDCLIKAKVNEMLFFNADVLFPIDRDIFTAYFAGKFPVDEEKLQQWYAMLDYLNNILTKNKWLAGDKMTLSDICCVATVSSVSIMHPLLERHIKIKEWIKKMQQLSYYRINNDGLIRLKNFVQKLNNF
ncbi:glutathione S-transferase 1-like isoform X1 [Phthorimaea operculella]|nr:glutathione S-transferase 1-like isoform X1 [Phthorimaea operculella]